MGNENAEPDFIGGSGGNQTLLHNKMHHQNEFWIISECKETEMQISKHCSQKPSPKN